MNKLPRPASLDRFGKMKSKKDEFLEEMGRQMQYYLQVYDENFKK